MFNNYSFILGIYVGMLIVLVGVVVVDTWFRRK